MSPKTIVKDSPIHGRGLFAREPIAKDDIVAIKGGYIFHATMLREVQQRLGLVEIFVTENLFIGPVVEREREGGMIFSNHSCVLNIGIQGQIVFVVMRNMQADEELTRDWATTDDDIYEEQRNCGASNCRKVITGQDWRRKDLQAKYRGCVAWYLQRKIDEDR